MSERPKPDKPDMMRQTFHKVRKIPSLLLGKNLGISELIIKADPDLHRRLLTDEQKLRQQKRFSPIDKPDQHKNIK